VTQVLLHSGYERVVVHNSGTEVAQPHNTTQYRTHNDINCATYPARTAKTPALGRGCSTLQQMSPVANTFLTFTLSRVGYMYQRLRNNRQAQ
jgi:hypothetical protein